MLHGEQGFATTGDVCMSYYLRSGRAICRKNLLKFLASAALLTQVMPACANETTNYSYDVFGRLTNVAHSGTVNNGVNAAYTHDAADNRSNVTVTGATCVPGTGNRYAITAGVTSWTVPTGVNCVTVYAIGAGGNGDSRGATAGTAQGGGGGSFAKLNVYATTPGASIPVQVAAAGSGNQTYWNNNTTLLANAGGNGGIVTVGAGGAAGVGDVTYAGGSSGNTSNNGGAGGGGAAGPDGAGKAGGNVTSAGASGGGGTDGLSSTAGVNNSSGTNGSAGGTGPGGAAGGAGSSGSSAGAGTNGSGGGGGGTSVRAGGAGSQYGIWAINAGPLNGTTVGPGSGGGGGNTSGATGATGGNAGGYGGGGGGSRTGGSGTSGIIVVVY